MFLRIPLMVRYTGIVQSEYRLMSSSSVMQISNHENIVTKKMNELITWYEQVTGMDEVRAAQNRVLEEEKKLAVAQEHRREVNKMVLAVQSKLRDLQAELDTTPRGVDRYVELITKEHSLLKEERRLRDELQQFEREERDYFTALSSAVKDSHEKERAQAQRTKYWSIIGSVIGTVIGIAGSSLNNHFKLKKFQQLVKESVDGARMDSANIPQLLHKQEQQLNHIVEEMKAISVLSSGKAFSQLHEMLDKFAKSGNISSQTSAGKMDNVIRMLNQQQAIIQNKFKELEVLIKHSLVPDTLKNMPPTQSPPQPQLKQDDIVLYLGGCALLIVLGVLYGCLR